MENSSKKRGRPRKYDPRIMRLVDPSLSGRSMQNHYRAIMAEAVLDKARHAWLLEAPQGAPSRWKRTTLLAEIGRIPWDGVRLRVADELCVLKPSVQEGVRRVRAYRLQLLAHARDELNWKEEHVT